jgi:hypothetical protein
MSTWELLDQKRGEVGPWLRRAFWLPMRQMLEMFHILPLAAALAVSFLLATDGQLREIYISYLENLGSDDFIRTTIHFVAAALVFALISAVLYQAHYLLSTTRISAVYSNYTELGGGSRLRRLQNGAAVVLALSPWLGLAAGLLNTKIYLAKLFGTLQHAGVGNINIVEMQKVPMPSDSTIIAGGMVLGIIVACLAVARTTGRALRHTVVILTPVAASIFYLLLTDPPQINPSAWQLVGIAGSVVLITTAYFFVYYRLYTMRARFVYSRFVLPDTGYNVRRRQRILLFMWVLLPWLILLALYFGTTFYAAPLLSAPSAPLHSWAIVPVVMSWAIATGIAVVLVLDRARQKRRLLQWTYIAVGSLAAMGLLLSQFGSANINVVVYRAIGPLGSLGLAILFVVSIFALLALLSQRSGFPTMTLLIVVLLVSLAGPFPIGWTIASLTIICVGVFGLAVASRLWAVACVALILAVAGWINFAKMHSIKALDLRRDADGKAVEQQFRSWLDRRLGPTQANSSVATPTACSAKYLNTSRKYPVFIFAFSGGGIYAASAASMFLARLQDIDSCFAEHVFAISAVSGGAIGSTIFQALEESRLHEGPAAARSPAGAEPGARSPSATAPATGLCAPPTQSAPAAANYAVEKEICAIIGDDHFSPLVASIFPELLGLTSNGRAQELSASFDLSVKNRDPAASAALEDSFDEFARRWLAGSKAPSLVLNATWVETGYRAAFAPFPLHAIDDSLYSFADRNMPDDPKLTLMDAAVVSARFPAVLPPYSVTINKVDKDKTTEKPGGTMLWNFVDGGYSDTSGATTALALYKALKDTAAKRNVDLRAILITSSDPQLEAKEINGTAFADILGPIDAMLSVRNGLGNEAVARTCDGVIEDKASAAEVQNSCEARANKMNSPLQIVGIEDETYGLSLGWKISQTTFGVVSWMLGEPYQVNATDCDAAAQTSRDGGAQANGQFVLNDKIVKRNSCVLLSIRQLLEVAPAK